MKHLSLFLLLLLSLTAGAHERTGWITVYNSSREYVDVVCSGHCSKRVDPYSSATFELPMGNWDFAGTAHSGKKVYSSLVISDQYPYSQWTITDYDLGY